MGRAVMSGAIPVLSTKMSDVLASKNQSREVVVRLRCGLFYCVENFKEGG
jgi:hypothetical protein